MAEARQAVAAAQPLLDDGGRIASPGDFVEQDFDEARRPPVQRSRQRPEPAEKTGGERGAGGCDDAHGEGRGVRFVIGQQHHGGAQNVGLVGGHLPGASHLLVDRLRAGHGAGDTGGDEPQQRCRLRPQPPDVALPDHAGIDAASCQKLQAAVDGPRTGGDRRHVGRFGRGERIVLAALPEQPRNLFEARGSRQARRIPATVIQPVIGDQRDAGCQHRRPPVERRAGDLVGFAAAGLGFGKALDIGGTVEAAPRILAVGPRLDQAAADIGIEAGPRNAETRGRCLGVEIGIL